MKRFAAVLLALAAAACASKPPVSSYGPPPPVLEPTPTADQELLLLVGDVLSEQEQVDLVAIHTTTYTPPADATPPALDVGLNELLAEEGAALIHEQIGYDIPIVLNDRVEWWIRYFADRIPGSFEKYMIRSGAWLPYLKGRLREAGLPEDLAYLAMIESGFSTRAVSHAGAVGPWQFMPYTGREYGLRIDGWVDERMDYERATGAAIEYLSDLHGMFGSWYLAAAGYNGGQGRVGRAMLRDNTVNFWELTNLHDETKNYVPKLIAATVVAKQPEAYGFHDIPYLDPVEFETVTVPTSTDLSVIARAAETPGEIIRLLNPHLLRGRTPPGEENFPVRIPADRVDEFNENYYDMPPDERLPETPTHLVESGETLSEIATLYGVEPAEILRLNDMRSARDVEAGMRLALPADAIVSAGRPADARGPAAATGQAAAAAGGNGPTASAAELTIDTETRTHRVERGDTLIGIARRYGVSVEALIRENDLRSETIRPGQRLRIP